MTIRPASTADVEGIRTVAHIAWPVAYHPHILTTEQLAYMLQLLYSADALEQAMNVKGQHFLVAELDGKPIGFAGFTPNHKVNGTTHLDKLYVVPSLQGSGLGKALLENVISETKRAGNTILELNVNKRNKAIEFYEHMGFSILREEVIDIGSGYVMDDYVMGRSI